MSYLDLEGWFNFEAIYECAVQQSRPGDAMVEVGIFLVPLRPLPRWMHQLSTDASE